jgi:predicted phosphodiesterase
MSKILIFSDAHFTPGFNQDSFSKLKKLIEQADQVVINGDLWEGYFFKFDDFLNSKWNQLFPLLKEKKTIYIYGNHDPEKAVDDRANQFADLVTDKYEFSSGGKDFVCLHGHQYIESPSKTSALIKVKFLLCILYLAYYLLILVLRRKFWKIYQFENDRLKKIQKQEFPGKYLVTGHTHLMEQTDFFINTGSLSFGFFEYTWIENGEIRQYSETYKIPFLDRFIGVFPLKKTSL